MIDTKKDYQKILGSVQKPVKGEAGKTGTWSSKKSMVDIEKCIPAKSGIHIAKNINYPELKIFESLC